jgi:phage-related baseplate assembly protein
MADPEFSLDDLTTPLTVDEIKTSIYDALAVLGVNTTSWKPGAVVRTMIAGVSIVLAGFSQLQAKIARSGFLELSEGLWLTLVAHYVYGVARDEATFANGEITLTNSGGGEYVIEPDDLIFRNPVTDKTYRNTSAFTLSPGGVLTVPIQATEAGSASTSAPATITDMTTPLGGVTCTNAAAVIGRDEESDPALRTRCSETLGALSPMGPWDAYSSAVRGARRADGTSLGVTRIRTTKDGFGNVTVYCANASGSLSSEDRDLADEAVQQWAAPLAVTADVEAATAAPIAITYELWLYNTTGLSAPQIQTLIASRLSTFLSSQPIGGNKVGNDPGKVFVSAIRTAIGAVLPQIFHVVVTSPAADVELEIDEVPILAGAPSVIAIHQVAPPEGFIG